MDRVTRAKVSRKRLQAGISDLVHVGLDVHKRLIHMAVWLNGRASPRRSRAMPWRSRASPRRSRAIPWRSRASPRLRRVNRRIHELAAEARHAPAVAVLESHPAVGPITAMTLLDGGRIGNGSMGQSLSTGMTANPSSAFSTWGDGGSGVVSQIESNTLCFEHE